MKKILTLLATLPLLGGSLRSMEIFSTDFTSHAGWYTSSGGGITEQGEIGLIALGRGGGRHMLTYFDKTSLQPGDTLTLAFDMKVSGVTGDSLEGVSGTTDIFRFGLFDSQEGGQTNRNTHGVSGTANTPNGLLNGFNSYIGYAASINFASTNSQMTFRERNESQGEQLLTALGGFTSLTENAETNANTSNSYMILGPNENYNVSLSLTFVSASQLDFILNISGNDFEGNSFEYYYSGSDDSGLVTEFDTFAFSVNNSTVDFSLTQVSLNSIPEPRTYGLIFGAAVLSMVYVFRKRH